MASASAVIFSASSFQLREGVDMSLKRSIQAATSARLEDAGVGEGLLPAEEIAAMGACAFTRDESCSAASRRQTTWPAIQILVLMYPSGPLKCVSLQCLGSMSE